MRTAAGSRYLSWILRTRGKRPRLDLTNSGMSTPLESLQVDLREILATEPSLGGDPHLQTLLARRYGVNEDGVLLTLGTSLALFLVSAATLRPGDRVLLESPGYEPLVAACRAVGAEVRRFPRRTEDGYRVRREAVLERLHPRTRLVGVSDLHNPTGARTGPGFEPLARELSSRGIYLLVDEVYRDFLPGPVGTARHLAESVIVVSSLTKVYGLGELRAGWILGPPALLQRIRSLLTLLHVVDPSVTVPFVRAALENAEALRAVALGRSIAGWNLVADWAVSRRDLRAVAPAGGVHVWIELERRRGSRVARRLLNRSGIAVVPGICFGDDRGIRIGVGGDPADLAGALEDLGRAIDETPLETP